MDGGWTTGAGIYRVEKKTKKQARRQKRQVKEKEQRVDDSDKNKEWVKKSVNGV